jgi:uncharacterized protein
VHKPRKEGLYLMHRVVCFYHKSDLDGKFSASVVKYAFPSVVLHPIEYGDAFPWSALQEGDTVFMVDFSLQPEEQMYDLMQKGVDLVWIDHHDRVIRKVERLLEKKGCALPSGWRTPDFAACELTWRFLFPDRPVPLAVTLVSLYDAWNFKGHKFEDLVFPFSYRMQMEDVLSLNSSIQLAALFEEDLVWIQSENCTKDVLQLAEEGKILLRYNDSRNAAYCEQFAFEAVLIDLSTPFGQPAKFAPKRAIVLNVGMASSQTFVSVYNPAVHDIMIFFCRIANRKWKVSLRSDKPHVDCSLIAETFGGNGHREAAGFLCDDLPFDY